MQAEPDGPKHLVFYAGLLYGEYTTVPSTVDIPHGAYLRHAQGYWYQNQYGWTQVVRVCLPDEYRVIDLLLT